MTPRPAICAVVVLLAASGPVQAQTFPGGFVYLRDIDPSIQQDIRYAGTNNFVGRRLTGYDAAECVVPRRVADALARVQRDLAQKKLSLKMFDCYRPVRAVQDMVAWSRGGRETPAQKRYNPKLRKQDLFRLGYIAERSGHSTGAAVDLSIIDLAAPAEPPFDPKADYADCTSAVGQRAPGDGVDMGTGYDCSDVKSHTASPDITPQQRQNRQTLVSAMTRHGFKNYSKEWWHFSYPGAGAAYDFSIVPRGR